MAIVYSGIGGQEISALFPDGTVIVKQLNPNPLTFSAIGEYKKLRLIDIQMAVDNVIGFNLRFNPTLYHNIVALPGLVGSTYYEYEITASTVTGTEYQLNLVNSNSSQINYKMFINFSDLTTAILTFTVSLFYYNTFDVNDWVKNTLYQNKDRFLKDIYNNATELDSSINTSVYNHTTGDICMAVRMEVWDTITNEQFLQVYAVFVDSAFYAKDPLNVAPTFGVAVFDYLINGLPSTNQLSTSFDTQVRVTIPYNATAIDHVLAWLIRTDNVNNSVDFITNYDKSFAPITTIPAAGTVLDNAIVSPSEAPTVVGATTEIYFNIDKTKINYYGKYRVIAIFYDEDLCVNSYISDELSCMYEPLMTGDDFNVMGILSDYRGFNLGNYLRVAPEERMKTQIYLEYSFNKYKAAILARLGLTINNDIKTYLKKYTVELYTEVTAGLTTTKQVLDRKIITNSGGVFTIDPAFAINESVGNYLWIRYPFRVRYEPNVLCMETWINGIQQLTSTGTQDWTGKTVYIKHSAEFEYIDYSPVFSETFDFIQKLSVGLYDNDAEDTTGKAEMGSSGDANVCQGEDACFVFWMVAIETDKLIGTFDKAIYGIGNIEEEENTWVPVALWSPLLPELSAHIISVNEEISNDSTGLTKGKICVDTNDLVIGQTYKVSAISKRPAELIVSDIVSGTAVNNGDGTATVTLVPSQPTYCNNWIYYLTDSIGTNQLSTKGYDCNAANLVFTIPWAGVTEYYSCNLQTTKDEKYSTNKHFLITLTVAGGTINVAIT
jgi:hypothetical protein